MPGSISTEDTSWVTMAEVAFGSITASYTTALTNGVPLLFIDIYNGTNAAIYLSFNATNNHLYVPPTSWAGVNLGDFQMHETSNISVKHAGVAPASGSLYISGGY